MKTRRSSVFSLVSLSLASMMSPNVKISIITFVSIQAYGVCRATRSTL